MTSRAFTGICIELTPYRKVCYSTLRNPTLAYEKVDIERGTSQPSQRPRYQPPKYVTRVLNAIKAENLMKNADFKCIYDSVAGPSPRNETKLIIMSTILYLLDLGFSKDVILESSPICYYDRFRIEKALKQIEKNEAELEKKGFKHGFTNGETHGFSRGSHLCDKRLQLCMYYMEKPTGFSFAPCKAFIKRNSYKRGKKKEVEELKILQQSNP